MDLQEAAPWWRKGMKRTFLYAVSSLLLDTITRNYTTACFFLFELGEREKEEWTCYAFACAFSTFYCRQVYSTVEWSIHDPILLFPSSSCLRILTLVFFRPYQLLVGIYSNQFFILPRSGRCTTYISHSNHWAPYCWCFNTYINDTFPHSLASFPFAFRTPTLLFSCYLSSSFSLLLFFVTCSTLLRSSIPIPLIYSTLFPSFAHTYI